MSKDQIILCSGRDDDHVDILIGKLVDLGVEPIRLNADEIPQSVQASFEHSDCGDYATVRILEGGRHIDSRKVKSIFFRDLENYNFPVEWTKQQKVFARNEVNVFFKGFFALVDCYWMNEPNAVLSAENKIEQLRRAALYGFRTPKTIVTNDPTKVKGFFEDCNGKIVFKTFSDPFLAFFEREEFENSNIINLDEDEAIPMAKTTLVTKQTLMEIDDISAVPGQFQELIGKKYDLRVTVIGNQVFAVHVHSQEFFETSLDWRASGVNLEHSIARLPEAFKQKCVDFVKSYNLGFGAMDFIVTGDGEYVFLENNPIGQFLAYEAYFPELKMAEAVSKCLINGGDV